MDNESKQAAEGTTEQQSQSGGEPKRGFWYYYDEAFALFQLILMALASIPIIIGTLIWLFVGGFIFYVVWFKW